MAKCRTSLSVFNDLQKRNAGRIVFTVYRIMCKESNLNFFDLDDRNFALAIELMIRSRRDQAETNNNLNNPEVLDYLTRCDDAADAVHEHLYQ